MSLHNFIFGNPLKTDNIESERLTKFKALAIFSSDVLSSVAYATEEILIVLGAVLASNFSIPISLTIATLLLVVCSSYWQTIGVYANGGGAFTVAHENLGEFCGLIAASALLIDYTLTVAVSLSAGASALTSAFPSLSKYTLSFCFIALFIITISNLRGCRESANVLSFPTYLFIFMMFMMILIGMFAKTPPKILIAAPMNNISNLAISLVVIRAFSSGCSLLTGIEAIASGVTAFKKPQYQNARLTLLTMAIILSSLFLGITFLTHKFHIVASQSETVISQIAKNVFGGGFLYYFIQLITACILLLAANTSFAGFPRLASILAKEQYLPSRFANLGDRLAYSNGIIVLAFVATILLLIFKGDTHALIPLYALGVFISYTLSQFGMVKHWFREKGENWHLKALINIIGATATFITLLIIIESKFLDGAWIITLIIPTLFCMFKKINTKYNITNVELDLKRGGLNKLLISTDDNTNPKVIVPISRLHKGTLSALNFAMSLTSDVTAVVVNVNNSEIKKLKLTWRAMNFAIPLVILNSPYRSIIAPLMDFLMEQDLREPEKGKTIIVMPSFVPSKLWQHILHNQTATILKTALLYKNHTSEQTRVIVEIPYQMKK